MHQQLQHVVTMKNTITVEALVQNHRVTIQLVLEKESVKLVKNPTLIFAVRQA